MSAIYPPGIILPYAGLANNLPTGWLLCDGSSISRASYSDLWDIIGITYGSDDGSTFRLPDLRGRVVAGVDIMQNLAAAVVEPSVNPAGRLTGATAGGVNGSTLGAFGGAQSHLLLSTESGIASHTHLTYANDNPTTGGGSATRLNSLAYGPADSQGQTSEAVANAAAAHNNVQPTIVLNYMIKI